MLASPRSSSARRRMSLSSETTRSGDRPMLAISVTLLSSSLPATDPDPGRPGRAVLSSFIDLAGHYLYPPLRERTNVRYHGMVGEPATVLEQQRLATAALHARPVAGADEQVLPVAAVLTSAVPRLRRGITVAVAGSTALAVA